MLRLLSEIIDYSVPAAVGAQNVSHSTVLSTGPAAMDTGIAMALACAVFLLIFAAGFFVILGARLWAHAFMCGQAGCVLPFKWRIDPIAKATMPDAPVGANGKIDGPQAEEEPFESPDPRI